jgi:hypothetical protein
MINEKTIQLIKDFIAELPETYREMYQDIANYAMVLGYTPKKTKSKDFVLDFAKSKVKRTILKMELYDNGKKMNGPGLRLKFYASKDYSDIFKKDVQRVIEEFNGKYTGCYGCGKCKGELEGYTFIYSDDTKVFRCGNELIAIHDFTYQDIPEIKSLLNTQDEYFMKNI